MNQPAKQSSRIHEEKWFLKSQVKKNQIRFVFIPSEMKIRENSENDFKVWLWKM